MRFKILLITFFAFQLAISDSFAERIVAKVGEWSITIDELKSLLKSKSYAEPVQELYKGDEDKKLAELLAEIVDFELLYLEAKRENISSSIEYKRKLKLYGDSVLARLYRKNLFIRKVHLPKKELREYAKRNQLTFNAARSAILKEKRQVALKNELSRLVESDGVIYSSIVKGVNDIKDDEIVVRSKSFLIRYGEIKQQFLQLGSKREELFQYLSKAIETKLFSGEAIKLNLEKKAEYADSLNEESKNLMVLVFKEKLLKRFKPTARKKELSNYLEGLRKKERPCK